MTFGLEGNRSRLADLSRHFQQRELVRGNTRIAYSTKKAYEGYLKKWIEPRWGEHRLLEIRAVEVESWLKSLNRAPGTRCKIRNVMSLLFNHGRRHDLCDRNPIQWVRQGAKRRTAPDILTRDEVQGLLENLRFRERTLVLLAVTTGLRSSELFALKWRDVDFQAKQIHVTRSIVQNVIGVCKTETSQKPVPAHDDLIKALREWHRRLPMPFAESLDQIIVSWNRFLRGFGLADANNVLHDRARYMNLFGLKVHVSPLQREQVAPPQAGGHGQEDQSPFPKAQ